MAHDMSTAEVLALGDELDARSGDPHEMMAWFSKLDEEKQQLLRDMIEFHFLVIPTNFQPLFAEST